MGVFFPGISLTPWLLCSSLAFRTLYVLLSLVVDRCPLGFWCSISLADGISRRRRNSGLQFRGVQTLSYARLRCRLVQPLGDMMLHFAPFTFMPHFLHDASRCLVLLSFSFLKIADSRLVSSANLISVENVSVGARVRSRLLSSFISNSR